MSDPHAPPVDDEPKSPMWLPALGAALFLGAALWWAVTPAAAQPATDAAASASAAPSAAPVAAAPTPPATVAAAGSALALPPGAHPFLGKVPDNSPVVPAGGSANPADLQKRIEQMREDLRKKRMPAGH
jgi:hypothetical protein